MFWYFNFIWKVKKWLKNSQKDERTNYISGFYFYSNKKDNLHVYIWKIIPSVYFNHQKLFEWVICIISKEFKGRMQNSIICNIKTTFKYMAGNWYVSYLFRNRDVPKIVIKIESDVYDKKSDWYLWMLLHVLWVSVTFNRFTPLFLIIFVTCYACWFLSFVT